MKIAGSVIDLFLIFFIMQNHNREIAAKLIGLAKELLESGEPEVSKLAPTETKKEQEKSLFGFKKAIANLSPKVNHSKSTNTCVINFRALRKRRKDAGLSQEDLGKASGLATGTIGAIEKGRSAYKSSIARYKAAVKAKEIRVGLILNHANKV